MPMRTVVPPTTPRAQDTDVVVVTVLIDTTTNKPKHRHLRPRMPNRKHRNRLRQRMVKFLPQITPKQLRVNGGLREVGVEGQEEVDPARMVAVVVDDDMEEEEVMRGKDLDGLELVGGRLKDG